MGMNTDRMQPSNLFRSITNAPAALGAIRLVYPAAQERFEAWNQMSSHRQRGIVGKGQTAALGLVWCNPYNFLCDSQPFLEGARNREQPCFRRTHAQSEASCGAIRGACQAHRGLRTLPASAHLLCGNRAGATACVCGANVLGQTCSLLWRRECARAGTGACAGGAWFQPHRPAVHRGWIGKFPLPSLVRDGICVAANGTIARRWNAAERSAHYFCRSMRATGQQTTADGNKKLRGLCR